MKERYEYKGNIYDLIDSTCRKCTTSNEWVAVVIYKSVKDGNVYVRDSKDFYMKFRQIYVFSMPKVDFK